MGCVRDHVLGRSEGWARVRVREGEEAQGMGVVVVVEPIFVVGDFWMEVQSRSRSGVGEF